MTDIAIEAITGDLIVARDGELLLRTFVSDPGSDELWHIRDNVTGTRLARSGRSLAIQVQDA